MKLEDHYTLAETLEKLRFVLTATRWDDSLVLLGQAISKASEDASYAKGMEGALLRGSILELRELFSVFGDYWAGPRAEFPFYPHSDAVNAINSSLGMIKHDALNPGSLQESIDFCNYYK
ncbi:hypothetical protein CAZ10_11105 [Pseudomonas aeruginosa]|uniref:Uncharacterized protein n=1 Tax=Pseudomonas aeruginosa TaxID=287 RepID=A0A241XSN9_PSEAI|nr:hypothetical protein CAZ10_11105 [Pseudomonas aeruginosa]